MLLLTRFMRFFMPAFFMQRIFSSIALSADASAAETTSFDHNTFYPQGTRR
jgi:hypothetical protein